MCPAVALSRRLGTCQDDRVDDAREPTLLERTLLEIEQHVAESGWDRPPLLYALVETSDLLEREPGLADNLGVTPSEIPVGALTPVEQEPLPEGPLDEALGRIEWPTAVRGCALIQEVLALPPDAEAQMPEGSDPVAYAADHPSRQEIRLAVAVLRDGSHAAAARVRSSDPADQVDGTIGGDLVVDPDLAPHLAEALAATLQ